jgi:hypothetical protein
MKPRKRFTVRRSDGPRSAWFSGPARIVMPAVRQSGSTWQWDNTWRAISVPISRADDVTAALEAAGHVVETPRKAWR